MTRITPLFRVMTALVVGLGFMSPVITANAEGVASLYLRGPGTVGTGQMFQVDIRLNAANADIDTVRVNGSYPADKVEWLGFTLGSSFPNTSPESGANPSDGTFSIGAFQFASGVQGDVLVARLLFRTKLDGEVSIQLLSNSQTFSSGINQISSVKGLKIAVSGQTVDELRADKQADESFTLASTSHPDQNAWYASRNITINWNINRNQISKVYFSFDRETNSNPTTEALEESNVLTVDDDGIYFAHIKFIFKNGEEIIRHLRFNIDTIAPAQPIPTLDQNYVEAEVQNTLRYGTTDNGSGVEKYTVSIDGSINEFHEPSHRLPRLSSGDHTIIVTALDRAGNSSSNSVTLSILGVDQSARLSEMGLRGGLSGAQFDTSLVIIFLSFIVLIYLLRRWGPLVLRRQRKGKN